MDQLFLEGAALFVALRAMDHKHAVEVVFDSVVDRALAAGAKGVMRTQPS